LVATTNTEGEGKIEDRVEALYAQLTGPTKPWVADLKQAGLILVSAHSQGTPVAALIVERLIKESVIDPVTQTTGILAIAGISHGPYPDLKSSVIVKYVEGDPARELFDFNTSASSISKRYHSALDAVLNSGCKFVAIGSWYDQVVPLYSATLQGFEHPNIYRAMYIDSSGRWI
jgi:hypothetical protein